MLDKIVKTIENICIGISSFYDENKTEIDTVVADLLSTLYHVSTSYLTEPTIEMLKKYNWVIPGGMHSSLIKYVKSRNLHNCLDDEKAINKCIVNFYIDNKCYRLKKMIEKWSVNNSFIKERIVIIKDCLKVVNRFGKKTASNVVLPTLIAQLEGAWVAIVEENYINGAQHKKECIHDLSQSISNDLTRSTNECSIDILTEVIFKSLKNETGTYEFNRHKILHGKTTEYGRIESVIKVFLLLDLLNVLSCKDRAFRENTFNDFHNQLTKMMERKMQPVISAGS